MFLVLPVCRNYAAWSVVSQEEIEGEREGVKRCLRVDEKALHPRRGV